MSDHRKITEAICRLNSVMGHRGFCGKFTLRLVHPSSFVVSVTVRAETRELISGPREEVAAYLRGFRDGLFLVVDMIGQNDVP